MFTLRAMAVLALISMVAVPGFSKIKKSDKFPTEKMPLISAGNMRSVASAKALGVGEFKGKVVIVDFWASWCEPCKVALPAYDKLYSKYKDKGLVVVGINVDDEKKSGVAFMKEHPVKFPVVFDEGKKLVEKVEVSTMPTSFIIGKDGKVTHIHKGFRDGDQEEVEKLLKKML